MKVKAQMNDKCEFLITLDLEAMELLYQACKRINISATELVEGLIISRLMWLDLFNQAIVDSKIDIKDNRYVRLLNWLNIFGK